MKVVDFCSKHCFSMFFDSNDDFHRVPPMELLIFLFFHRGDPMKITFLVKNIEKQRFLVKINDSKEHISGCSEWVFSTQLQALEAPERLKSEIWEWIRCSFTCSRVQETQKSDFRLCLSWNILRKPLETLVNQRRPHYFLQSIPQDKIKPRGTGELTSLGDG